MSKWSDRFNNHVFCTTLNELSKKIEENSLPENSEENIVSEYSRITKVAVYLETILKSVDHDLTSPHVLNEMAGQMQNALKELNNFYSDNNLGHLQNINNYFDHVLSATARLFTYYKKPTKTDLNGIQSSYSHAIDQHLEIYKKKINQNLEEVKSSSNALEENINKASEKLELIKKSAIDLEGKVNAKITDSDKQFTDRESKIDKKFDELGNNLNTKMDTEFVSLTTKSVTIINALDKLQKDAEQVFGVVQNTVQAGAHMLYANKEKNSANRYRFGAISLMLTAVAIIIIPEILHIIKDINYTFNWDNLLKRVPVSLVLFVPAFYLARESNKHRQNEFKNRRHELILRTVDPYLSLLEEKNREEIKGTIAKSIFCDSYHYEQAEDNQSSLNKIVKMIGTALKIR